MECGSICRSAIQCLPSNLEAWLLFSRTGEGVGEELILFRFLNMHFIPIIVLKVNKGETVHFLLDNYIIFMAFASSCFEEEDKI